MWDKYCKLEKIMRLTELTKEPLRVYREAVGVLDVAVQKIDQIVPKGYWMGEVLDILGEALTTITPGGNITVCSTHNQHNKVGGSISHTGTDRYVIQIKIPVYWRGEIQGNEYELQSFVDIMRRSGIKQIATTFAHEVGHAIQSRGHDWKKMQAVHYQQQFDEKRDLNWQRNYAKYAAQDQDNPAEVRAAASQFLYLTKKNEIEMQAYSAAQELWNHYEKSGSNAFRDIIKTISSWDNLKGIKWSGWEDFPHLAGYLQFMREGPYKSITAYNRFLKKLVQYLNELKDEKL